MVSVLGHEDIPGGQEFPAVFGAAKAWRGPPANCFSEDTTASVSLSA